MALHVVDHPTHGFSGLVSSFASGIGGVFAAIFDGLSKSRQYQALSLLSDRELADLGVQRDELVQYVFADRKV